MPTFSPGSSRHESDASHRTAALPDVDASRRLGARDLLLVATHDLAHLDQEGAVKRESGKLGLTTTEAAAYLGVTTGTIRRWSDRGHLPHTRTPGGQRRFSQKKLKKFADSLLVK